ncbi:MAG: helix-turn-helix transcriptional regulator [bacterium]|nr:helix-turn-helix transcriptional regulator [bacterium]
MGRKSFEHMNCGIAQSLEILGDWWTLLVVRDAFLGVRRFRDFEASLGIAKNVLTDRLQRLVEHEILETVDIGESGTRYEYRLTEKGLALLPIVTSLREWGEEWILGEGNEPILVKDRRTGRRLPKLRLRDADGNLVEPQDLVVEAGPGADRATAERFRE